MKKLVLLLWTDASVALKFGALLVGAGMAALATLDPHDQTVTAILAGLGALGVAGHAAR